MGNTDMEYYSYTVQCFSGAQCPTGSGYRTPFQRMLGNKQATGVQCIPAVTKSTILQIGLTPQWNSSPTPHGSHLQAITTDIKVVAYKAEGGGSAEA